jgi:hypothetical protein
MEIRHGGSLYWWSTANREILLMSMSQAAIVYGAVFLALLLGLWAHLGSVKFDWQKMSSHFNARKIAAATRSISTDREFWLKVCLATFIALSSGVALVTFLLPYGAGWVLVALSLSLLVLAVLLPYLLAR